MARRARRRIPVEASSGNVFGDLKLPDAAELDPKVRLAVRINGLIAAKGLNQDAAAARLQIGQPKISELKRYRLDGFSFGRLMSFLLALGQDVEIHIRPGKTAESQGKITVQGS